MKLELKPSTVIPNAYILEINLAKIPKCIEIPPVSHHWVFDDMMDKAFVLKFDCRRIGPWHRWNARTYWAYVTLPEKK